LDIQFTDIVVIYKLYDQGSLIYNCHVGKMEFCSGKFFRNALLAASISNNLYCNSQSIPHSWPRAASSLLKNTIKVMASKKIPAPRQEGMYW